MVDNDRKGLEFRAVAKYLSVEGSFIDQLGNQPEEKVTFTHCNNRITRDGNGHHVTFVNHLEMATLSPPPKVAEEEESVSEKPKTNSQLKKQHKKVLKYYARSMLNQFGSADLWKRPVDLGLGMAKEGEAVSFFRVLHWPFGQSMRSYLGLKPTNFHITVGFAPRDVHVYKGPASLVCLQKDETCSKERVEILVGYATYYFNDREFISKLYGACMRHGYYKQVIHLTKFCIFCKIRIVYIYDFD